MKQYQELLEEVLENGRQKGDRTGTGTISVFGVQKRYDLRKGFPLLTTKKTAFRIIVEELMWFLKGDTNIRTLLFKDVKIWNDDAYKNYIKRVSDKGYPPINQDLFLKYIREDDEFAAQWGDLGPIYSEQWRSWKGVDGVVVDQIKDVIAQIKNNPDSRRHLVTAWNPAQLDEMALPPCHVMFQFYVIDGEISLHLYQRSGDLFLGIPFNIASYALLLHLVAKETGLVAAEFVHTVGDLHLYNDHIEKAQLQLTREPRELPTLQILNDRENVWDYEVEDFELIGYDPHPRIEAQQSS